MTDHCVFIIILEIVVAIEMYVVLSARGNNSESSKLYSANSLASSPGGRNDLVHTVMRMRLIFLMNIHKNHCIGGAC